jgi:hypothetical protein
MPKAVIRIGYNDYVMEVEDAVTIAKVMAGAPRYQSRGYGETASYHIWDEPKEEVTITLISDEVVRIAAMAGKYQDK